MNLSDALRGCGASIGNSTYPDLLLNQHSLSPRFSFQEVLAMWQYAPCPHGPECILCQEKATREAYQLHKLDEERKAKKADYENRCKEYLKKFRGNK